MLAILILYVIGSLDRHAMVALVGGGIAVAGVGFVDDRRPLAAWVRLLVHLGAALWALMWLGGLPILSFGHSLLALGAMGYLLGVFGTTWALNLFNFMDGIDGLAASEAVFMAWAGAWLTFRWGGGGALIGVGLALGAASLGFLLWNWPPAKIFMGDVGSGYLGYVIAVLAIASARQNSAALFAWLILGGVFFSDATMTLIRRLLRGERVYQAHRTHGYQWLARRWRSHGRTTLTVMTINLLWLLPWAAAAVSNPPRAARFAIAALTPVAMLAYLAGAGRRES